jgi:Zn finger protein HypA/HybF involved in hydrogenase expression
MAIFGNLGKKIGDAASAAAKNTKEMMEASKINSTINGVEGSIKTLYYELGEKFYKKLGASPDIDAEFMEISYKIKQHELELVDLRIKLLEAKNVWVCPKCEVEVEKEQAFCAKCGSKQPEAPVAPAPPSA